MSDTRLTYKLVIDRDGTITEEPFENYETMLERVKVLTEPAPVVEPAAPAEAETPQA